MPYTFPNPSHAKAIAQAKFWNRDAVVQLNSTLFNTNITVVESLRDAKAAFNTFMTAGQKGVTLFNTANRWPEAEDILDDRLYYTTADGKFARLLGLLAAALDDRVISTTREQANQTGGQVRGQGQPVGEDNGRDQQNAFKHLAELRIQLALCLDDESIQWDRMRAEMRIPAVWA